MSAVNSDDVRLAAVVPGYVLDHDSPAGLFTRLQRVVIFLEMLQVEAVKEFDISYRDFVILATLRKEDPPHALPVSQIADYVIRPMGSISHAVDRVERKGLVRRETPTDDRRKVIVTLTREGRALADQALTAYDAIRERVFARLSSAELGVIDDSVSMLLEALEADHWEQTDEHR